MENWKLIPGSLLHPPPVTSRTHTRPPIYSNGRVDSVFASGAHQGRTVVPYAILAKICMRSMTLRPPRMCVVSGRGRQTRVNIDAHSASVHLDPH